MFAELSTARQAGLVVLKLGDVSAHVDNMVRLFKDGLYHLRHLRYVEFVSSMLTYDKKEHFANTIAKIDDVTLVFSDLAQLS